MDEIEQLTGALEQTLEGVREYSELDPVELRRDMKTGRLMLTAYSECHSRMTQIDLWDLLEWLQFGPPERRVQNGFMFPARQDY